VTQMPDYDDVLKRSSERSPFANGTEGEAWMSAWCSRPGAKCVRDEQYGGGPEKAACPLLDVALFENRTPAEWGARTSAIGREMYTCSRYVTES
jgi:hypothetical protein